MEFRISHNLQNIPKTMALLPKALHPINSIITPHWWRCCDCPIFNCGLQIRCPFRFSLGRLRAQQSASPAAITLSRSPRSSFVPAAADLKPCPALWYDQQIAPGALFAGPPPAPTRCWSLLFVSFAQLGVYFFRMCLLAYPFAC